ncbi:outer membrane lipoprotein-sorting protein [Pseudobacteriovorax antillogorgiicola]|uniref:Outer membrane lipoprotein-sorting protein n=1 Tax=Pseudobacteriovorax antillogorgiicola TaxID=1513793 RepID=A0A1Y6CMH5_9BACT|nr:outer membrane lipoprotein-sorting protein [Pseudobacteriovorax antillogorgiicola]TCS45426.1 outer membrane lipoprotein-sorting protein [Pseudobacteriovorax antillogorgiicola]SMF74185.1 outer membrane lipoprotein-sorting protein [Pseudobacteriovorax antillogorgiicola]
MRILWLLVSLIFSANAQLIAKPNAQTIVDRYTERNALGIHIGEANLSMLIRDRKGREKNREMTLQVFENSEERANLLRVMEPSELKGTTLLFREQRKVDQSQMHLFLPQAGKPRRIGDNQKKSPFVASDFTFGDLDSSYLNGAALKLLGSHKVDQNDCYEIEVLPKQNTIAKRIVLYIRKDSYLAEAIKYYDTKNQLYKVFKLIKSEKTGDQWLARQSQMWNKKTGSVTAVKITKIDAKAKLQIELFTPERMTRAL